jgi:hypothetical protein
MSAVTAEERRRSWLSAAPATAPPAGPDRTVWSGDRRTSSGVKDAPAGRVLMRAPHPFEYKPFQYEGYKPYERVWFRETDISMRLIDTQDASP